MELEQHIAEFVAWLNDRDAEFARRRRFTYSEARRDRLKADIAELDAIRDAFQRLVLQPLSDTGGSRMDQTEQECEYELISLSGGGYRAALYNAGALRAFHVADMLDKSSYHMVNAVSGGAIPTLIWREYLSSSRKGGDALWPEKALFDLVLTTPSRGGGFNWHLRWLVYSLMVALLLGYVCLPYLGVCLAILTALAVFVPLALRSGLDARLRWLKHLEQWWQRHPLPPSPLGLSPFFTAEVLDYLSGSSWIYDKTNLAPATRENIKTREPSAHIPMSVPTAIATATAFPPIFAGLHIKDNGVEQHLFKDAGVIDNLAMLPMLRIIERIPRNGKRLGTIARWFICDAGAPMGVPNAALLAAEGNTRPVKSVGLVSHIFRLAGDLAQPRFVKAMTDILEDYAGISATIIGIGVSRPENEGPWIAPLAGEPEPADVPTAVAGIPKHLALRIYSEGAQAVSAVLVKDGLMTPDQRATLRQLIVDEIAGTI